MNKQKKTTRTKTKASAKKAPGKKVSDKAEGSGEFKFEENYQLPQSYGTSSVTLIVRDPYWIYAYWDMDRASLDSVKKKAGVQKFNNSRHVLRIYDVTLIDFNGNNANHSFDIFVGSNQRDWYINLMVDNATYCADFGLMTPDGEFYSIARSNYVTTQRANVSGRSEMIWMNVENGNPVDTYVYAEPAHEFNGDVMQNTPFDKIDYSSVPQELSKKARMRIALTEDDIRSYYSRMFPLLCRVSLRKKRARGRNGKDPYAARLGLWELESSLKNGLSLSKIYEKFFVGASAELLRKRGGKEMPGGASEHLIRHEGASEALIKRGQRKFFFEIGTELIVYGRTQPDAYVTLDGRKVDLRPDGTFSMRFALPSDGKIPLNFVAQSNDRIDIRTIKTSAERSHTEYCDKE